MNKKLLVAVVVVGIGAGLFWSYQSNHHQMSSDMNHSSMDKKMMAKMDLPDQLRKQLDQTVLAYFDIQKALSKDDLAKAKKSSKQISSTLMTEGNSLSGHPKTVWEKETQTLLHTLKVIQSSKNISEARNAFEKLSWSIEMLMTHFGGPKGQHIVKYHCPMVDNNRGASWIQNSEGTQNPYYGSQMLSCGSKVKEM